MENDRKNKMLKITGFLWMIPFLLAFSTVFVINRDLANGVVSGKYFWFYASMGIVNLVMFIFVVSSKRKFRFGLVDCLVALFTGSVLFSSLVINDTPRNVTKWIVLALLVVLYFNLRLFLSHENTGKYKYICFFILFTGLVEAIWGLRQLYGFASSQHSLFKLTGSFFNPGPYAGYLAIVFPMALYVGIHATQHTPPAKLYTLNSKNSPFLTLNFLFLTLSSLVCIAILLVLPAAMSRAAWLAVVAGSLVVLGNRYRHRLAFFKRYYRQHKKKMIIATVTITALILATFAGMYLLKKDSADGRALMWKISLQTAVKHPFGVGLGNFSGAYGETQAEYFAAGKGSETEKFVAGGPEYGFNEYLQILVESGIVSWALLLAIIVLSIRASIINQRWTITGSMAALLVFACFSYPFSVLPFLIIFVFLLAAGNSAGKQDTGSRSVAVVVTCICLLVSGVCLYKEYPVYRAYGKWNREKIYYGAGMYREATEAYRELYPYLNDQVQFLFEYAQSLSKSEQYAESNKVLTRAVQISCDPMLYNIMGKNCQAMRQYDRTEEFLMKSVQTVPNRLYPWYLLMKLHVETGNTEKARQAAKMVLTREPKVQSQAVREMREEAKLLLYL